VVLFRLLALYMLVTATFSISTLIGLIRDVTQPGFRLSTDLIVFIISVLAHITFALLLLVFAKRCATYVTRGLENTSVQLSDDNFAILQAIAFSILGAYVLSFAIPNLVKIIALYLTSKGETVSNVLDDFTRPPAMREVPIEYLIQTLAQFAFGLWLVVGARGITRVIRKTWASNIKAE
jgi:hypothetical protein